MSSISSPKKVKINRITRQSVFALVEDIYPVWIHGLGTDNVQYSCSCEVWEQNIETGNHTLCSHYLAVIAKLIIEGKISKGNITGPDISPKIDQYIKTISEFEKSIEQTNLGYVNSGKMALCGYCKHLPLKTIVIEPEPLDPYHIAVVNRTAKGFIINGTARCVRCGKLEKIVNRINVELSYLKCPTCGKGSLEASLMTAKSDASGSYEFSIILSCKSKGCIGRRALFSGGHSASNLLNRLKKLKVAKDGIEVELK